MKRYNTNLTRLIICAVGIVCTFFIGFAVARITQQNTTELYNEMWHRYGGMTITEMRESIMVYGAQAFEDATGIHIIFDTPGEIVSIADPNVIARGFSPQMHSFIHVLFTYQHHRDGWRVEGYDRWGGWWNMYPQLYRGTVEGRRHIDAHTIDVSFYGIVDWGGGVVTQPVNIAVPGESFADEFLLRFYNYVGVNMLDMWFIGDSRLYVNLDGEILNTQGSAQGFAILVSLYNTLFSIADVEEVVVLVDGQSETSGWHIGFPYISRRNNPEIQTFLQLPQT